MPERRIACAWFIFILFLAYYVSLFSTSLFCFGFVITLCCPRPLFPKNKHVLFGTKMIALFFGHIGVLHVLQNKWNCWILFQKKQKRCWGACNLLTVVNLLCCAFFWTNCKTSSGAVRVFCSSGFFQNLFCCLKKVAVCGLFQCRLFLNRSEFWQTLLLWKHPMLHKWTVVLNMTYMETSTQLHIHACRSSG